MKQPYREKKYAAPQALLLDRLPHNAFHLASALFFRADLNLRVSLTYEEITILTGIIRRNTISSCLKQLEKRGWIASRRHAGNSAQVITLQIPIQYRDQRAAPRPRNVVPIRLAK